MTTDDIERFELRSANPVDERLAAIAELFPEVMREGTVDFDALRRSLGDWVDPGPERFGLTWPGKAECMRVIQEPSIGTLVPMPDESVDWDTTENVIIEGENLEVLKLLQKAYYGKVKMIYIDPPYNTGKEFIYPDNFKEGLTDYLRYSGQVDDEGLKLSANAETDGRYHSKWLSMMYPRLFLARNLLEEDGFILVSIDDHEVHNLRAILNDIFGEENFVSMFAWQSSSGGGIRPKHVSQAHEYILMYARSAESLPLLEAPLSEEAVAQYTMQDEKGPYREKDFCWKNPSQNVNQRYPIEAPDGQQIEPKPGHIVRFIRSTFDKALEDGLVVFKESGSGPFQEVGGGRSRWNIYIKKYLSEGVGAPISLLPKSVVGLSAAGGREVSDLLDGDSLFDYPKPTALIRYFLTMMGSEGLVLDFFAGSGTTADAVLRANTDDGGNRRFLLVQLPEPVSAPSETISNLMRERVRASGRSISGRSRQLGVGPLDSGFRSYRLSPSNFTVWDATVEGSEALERQLEMNVEHVADDASQSSMLTELLLKAGFPLTAPVEDMQFAGVDGYSVADGALVVCLSDEMTIGAFEAMVERDPAMILVLDKGFGGSDELKVNALQTVRARNQREGTDIALKVV